MIIQINHKLLLDHSLIILFVFIYRYGFLYYGLLMLLCSN